MGGVGGLLSIRDESGVYVPVYDGNGNVIALIDNGSGQQVASWTYGPFGESLGSTGRADLCPMGFATHYTDEESGLVYFGHRYYAPETGRWLSHEPLGEMESWNLYAYCHNDPVNKIDILGLNEYDSQKVSILKEIAADQSLPIGERLGAVPLILGVR